METIVTQEQTWKLKDLVVKVVENLRGMHDIVECDNNILALWNDSFEKLDEIERILKLDQVTSLYRCKLCREHFHANPLHISDYCPVCGERIKRTKAEINEIRNKYESK